MRKQKTNVGALSVRNTKKNLPNCDKKGNKGITLVALILTIVVLLILAVVAIRAVQGDGIISHAKNAKTKYNSAQEEEQINIALNEWKIAQNLPGNTKTMKVILEEKLAGVVTEVTDKGDYVEIITVSGGIYKIDKITNKEYVPDPALNPSGTIPVGATYTTGLVYNPMQQPDESNATKYTAGQNFPETLTPGDRYQNGDYTYYYSVIHMGSMFFPNQNGNGWYVKVNDTSKSSYGTIVESINGQPVADMQYTFSGFTSLTTAPAIPNSVTDMQYTFSDCTSLTSMPTIGNSVVNMKETFKGCTSLTTAPTIPNSVTDMQSTFQDCTSLTSVPIIGNSVTNMICTFWNCTSLKGNVEINGNPENTGNAFINCAQDEEHRITIIGSASQETKEALKATGYNNGEFISIE